MGRPPRAAYRASWLIGCGELCNEKAGHPNIPFSEQAVVGGMGSAGHRGTACVGCAWADQGSALSERSEFAETPPDAPNAGKPEGPVTLAGKGHTAHRRSPQRQLDRCGPTLEMSSN